jgi:hypothetical protein
MKFIIISAVSNGTLNRNKNLIKDAIASFEGKNIEITIEKAKKKRSNPQNSYFHGVVLPIVYQCLKDAGHTLSLLDVKEMLKLKFLKVSVMINEDTGEVLERIKNTSELTTSDFMDFIAEIQIFVSEYFDVQIPDPNENMKLM